MTQNKYGYDIVLKSWESDMIVDLKKDGVKDEVSSGKKKMKKCKEFSSLSKTKNIFLSENLDMSGARDWIYVKKKQLFLKT